MSATRVKVEGEKYEFIVEDGNIEIRRYGQDWVESFQAPGEKAVMALIFELEAVREELKTKLMEKPYPTEPLIKRGPDGEPIYPKRIAVRHDGND